MTSPRTSAPSSPAGGAGSSPALTVAIVVIYGRPTDEQTFERHYASTHVPLLNKYTAALGIKHVDLVKFESTLDGGRAPHYRKADLWFESEAALRRALAMPEWRELGGDLGTLATGGATAMIARRTNG